MATVHIEGLICSVSDDFLILNGTEMLLRTYCLECRWYGWQGFGVAAKSTADCRHVDPMTIVVFHQADIGEYIRNEAALT